MSSKPKERLQCYNHEYLLDPHGPPLDRSHDSGIRSALDEIRGLQQLELQAPPPTAVTTSGEDSSPSGSGYSDSTLSTSGTHATAAASSPSAG